MTDAAFPRRQFASDNYAGICPEAFAAMQEANHGHEVSYGDDSWTEKARKMVRDVFEKDCEVFFVFNGTSANSLALAHLARPYQSILCNEIAHVEVAECAGPEFFSGGAKVRLVPGTDGKLDPTAVERVAKKRTDGHFPLPAVLSITQATEVGTVYSTAEVKALAETCRSLKMKLHMDGARFANAVVAQGVKPYEITWEAGVDVLSFGATKNGLAVGEAVVFFDHELAREFDYRRKQGGQLASKMRFLSAPWVGILREDAWLRHARHANAMAARLAADIKSLPTIRIAHPVQTNSVFVHLPDSVLRGMYARGWKFYTHVGVGSEARLMCSWDTTDADVDAFAKDLKELTTDEQ
jgi:threonine aldolase